MSWVEFSEQGCWREVSVAGLGLKGLKLSKQTLKRAFASKQRNAISM